MRNGFIERASRVGRVLVWLAVGLAAANCGGEQGLQGPAGAKGEPGAPGQDGTNGTNGTDGTDGENGTDGKDGENGTNGTDGKDGENGTDGKDGSANTLSFVPVAAPVTDAEKRQVISAPEARVNGVPYALSYVVEARSGDVIGTEVFGRITDKNGQPVKNADNSDFISPSNDFSSILQVGGKLFEVTHFETQPGAMYLSTLTQDAQGKLSIDSTKPVDFSGVHGLWNPCAGSVTPWGTHLGSEEYPQDGRQTEGATTTALVTGSANVNILRYWGLDPATATVAQAKAVFNPYHYGFPVEVAVDVSAKTTVKKHYAMGRHAVELAYVMPDQKTVYITDDGTNDSLQMFVAKTAGDLSEGRLYAARWFQTSPAGAPHGTADIYWIELGQSAKSSDVEMLVNNGIKFSDIFDVETPHVDPATSKPDGTCDGAAQGFRWVNVDSAAPGECIRLKTGMELAASRLENRRYAAYLGATTEFRKLEGITYNAEGHRLYVSFSELNNGTEHNNAKSDLGGPNHIRLAANKCGAVFEFVIEKDPVIGTDYVAHAARALVEGIWLQDPANPNPYPADSPYAGKNECSVSSIANPDNLSFVPGFDTLIIGEDSGSEHQNDAVWAYNLGTGELNRILTTPYGAETTGVYFYPDIGGHAYIKTQVQHPYGESDQTQSMGASDLRSYTGYIGPLPSMSVK
ncbi:Alkaline phosphatase [Minicystis rosea]|nr:Alkaline phosphatase [Minicystis rosea]